MKVWIDQDLCTGDGLCEEIAPDVFTLLDDGLAYVKEGDKVFSNPGGSEGMAEIPEGQLEAVIESAEECPGETCPRAARSLGQEPGVGEEARVGDHAVIGAHGDAFDVPGAQQHLQRLGHGERGADELLAQLRRLDDARRVGDEDATRAQRVARVLHDLPRLGQVEHDAVEIGHLDACVRVAHLEVVPRHRLLVEERRHVGRVIDNAPEPTPDSSTRCPGWTSASMRIGPRSLG
jgi:ferredoxin